MTREIAEAFEEETGTPVNVHYAGTNVLVNQMIAEMDNPEADVWYGGGGILPFESAIERGFIQAYTPELASGYVNRHFFESLYARVAPQILFEFATDGPGFMGDEPHE